ncbi:MAG: diguanylate cyclase [Desulfuromonadaceae bacterium]
MKQIAELFKLNLRPGDIACRYGGEEFALLLYRAKLHEAYELAEGFRKVVEETTFPGQELLDQHNLTISGGIAVFPDHSTSASDLLAHADKELYHAKEQRNFISPTPNGQRQEIRHQLQSLVEFSLNPHDIFHPALSFDISSTGLSFGCSQGHIQTGTILWMRLRQPFWPTNWELRGTVRNIRKQKNTPMVRVGLEFDECPENIWILLPERPQPFKTLTETQSVPSD